MIRLYLWHLESVNKLKPRTIANCALKWSASAVFIYLSFKSARCDSGVKDRVHHEQREIESELLTCEENFSPRSYSFNRINPA